MNKPLPVHAMRKLYQSLGKLFYAIAAADRVVRKEERDTLRSLVRQEWLEVDEVQDAFGSDAAYQIETVFDWLEENNLPAQELFLEFKDFKKEHEFLFDLEIKALIWKTCMNIATAFSGKNKKELVMLENLKKILN